LGYKTFGKWIDESYDDESNCEVRALMITNEIKKLSEKTTDELVTIREEMKEVCIFNQMKFKELYDEKYGQDNLNKEIVDIFNDVWDSLKN
jgi:predicted AlkP superfamily phosphohydrolase/phosphomutase